MIITLFQVLDLSIWLALFIKVRLAQLIVMWKYKCKHVHVKVAFCVYLSTVMQLHVSTVFYDDAWTTCTSTCAPFLYLFLNFICRTLFIRRWWWREWWRYCTGVCIKLKKSNICFFLTNHIKLLFKHAQLWRLVVYFWLVT